MRTHPPIFNRLTNRLDARHPVNVLARRIAHGEKLVDRINEITRRLKYQRAPRFTNYRPDEGDCS